MGGLAKSGTGTRQHSVYVRMTPNRKDDEEISKDDDKKEPEEKVKAKEESTPSISRETIEHDSGLFLLKDVVESLPPPPPLTTMQRERIEAEIELLSRLAPDTSATPEVSEKAGDGPDAVADLWNFWYQERGAAAANKILKADEYIGKGGAEAWSKAETILKELVEEHGVWWAEPVNRLATIYYLQGRLEESERMCHTVLAVKPWHFGALSGIGLVYNGLYRFDLVKYWSGQRMPSPLAVKDLRKEWVKRAIMTAQRRLLRAEDALFSSFPQNTIQADAADDAWQ